MMGTMTMTSPHTVMGERTRDPIGTGPYRFVSWTPGASVVLERFPDYWGEMPEVAKVTYVFPRQSAVRAAMVATGEADIAPNIAVQDATEPAMDFSYLNSETSSFRIDVSKPPLDDVRVRKALNLAIDRDAMIGSIFSEDVVKATQMVVPSINGHNPTSSRTRTIPSRRSSCSPRPRRTACRSRTRSRSSAGSRSTRTPPSTRKPPWRCSRTPAST